MNLPTIITTERLRMEPADIRHAPQILRMLNSELFIQNIGDRGIHTIEQAEEYIRNLKEGGGFVSIYDNYIIFELESGEYVGNAGLFKRKDWHGMDIGYSLLQEYHGKGYATEAAGALVDRFFKVYDLDELQAVTSQTNIPSQKVLERLGFKRKGFDKIPNVDEELFLFCRSRGEMSEPRLED